MRKILYSPGYGAGWSTWCYGSKEQKLFMLEYKPFIEALEKDPQIDLEPLVEQFEKDFEIAFPGEDAPYTGGVTDLKVMSVSGRVHIKEYDGFESVIEEDCADYWI